MLILDLIVNVLVLLGKRKNTFLMQRKDLKHKKKNSSLTLIVSFSPCIHKSKVETIINISDLQKKKSGKILEINAQIVAQKKSEIVYNLVFRYESLLISDIFKE